MTQTPPERLGKDEAVTKFRALVSRYGLRWDARVPQHAYEEMARVNEVLDERDRRTALLGVR